MISRTSARNLTILLGSSLTVLAATIISPALPGMASAFAGVPNADFLVRLTLTMPALHTVTVQFSGATVPNLFHLTRLDDVLPAKITVPNLDRSRTVYVNSLPPGTYEVAVGGKKRNIEVLAGMTVDWQ